MKCVCQFIHIIIRLLLVAIFVEYYDKSDKCPTKVSAKRVLIGHYICKSDGASMSPISF